MQIGNDIVDLSAFSETHPRFSEKVLHPRDIWNGDTRELWRFWTAKEAAYKALRQCQDIPFHPREWAIDFQEKTAIFRAEAFHLLEEKGDGWIMTIVYRGATDLAFAHEEIAVHASPDEQSTVSRRLAFRLSASQLKLSDAETDHLSIRKHEGIPRLYLGDRLLPLALSLSHDGRFASAAIAWL